MGVHELGQPGLDVFEDEDEKMCWKKRGDPVLHI